jgi:hypothetical protein
MRCTSEIADKLNLRRNIKRKFGSFGNLRKEMNNKLRRPLEEAIEEYQNCYSEKPTRLALKKEKRWVYNHFQKNGLLDKYCKPKLVWSRWK